MLEKIRAAAAAQLDVVPNRSNWWTDARGPATDARSPSPNWRPAGSRVDATFANDNRLTYTYGSAAAHVAVDPGTGHVELLDCVVVEDVGRIVNPLTLHGQAIGGAVQGLGGAFLENLVYNDSGQLLAGNLADYLIPTRPIFRAFGRSPWKTTGRPATPSASRAPERAR